jgi:hypothetical protein
MRKITLKEYKETCRLSSPDNQPTEDRLAALIRRYRVGEGVFIKRSEWKKDYYFSNYFTSSMIKKYKLAGRYITRSLADLSGYMVLRVK